MVVRLVEVKEPTSGQLLLAVGRSEVADLALRLGEHEQALRRRSRRNHVIGIFTVDLLMNVNSAPYCLGEWQQQKPGVGSNAHLPYYHYCYWYYWMI